MPPEVRHIPGSCKRVLSARCLQCGTVGEQGVILPPPLPLTSERLERHGLFLIEDGQTIFLWVGRDAVPQLIMDVFNLPNYEVLRGGKVSPITVCSSPHLLTGYPSRRRCRCWRTHSRSVSIDRAEDSGDASRCLPSAPLHRQGGRRAATAAVGPSAVSSKTVPTSCPATSSSSASSGTR